MTLWSERRRGARTAPSSPSVGGARRRGRWSSARIGQFTTEADFTSEVDALDRDYNALALAICGTARGVGCDTPTARTLGAPWLSQWRETLGSWREWRDDFRRSFMHWAMSTESEIDGWRRELVRFRADVATVQGHEPTATPAEQPAGPLEGLGETLSDLAHTAVSESVAPAILVVGILAGLYLFSQRRR